ncbi:MAG TPA: prephenate dehydrogenase/arogenate dehydrogenase family protein [Myxococcales bacterium]|nr:prephenate dehydrogenase/arogenate dehydrogenase family protein [Myxococcales bacterium]
MYGLQRLGIIGVGLIGGSLALALRRSRPNVRILGVDVDPHALEQALEEGAIQSSAAPDEAPLLDCDLVVLAQPAQALLDSILSVTARMRPGAVLTDVCGSKEMVCARAAQQNRVVFVGAHPMAGTEFRGFAAASPAMFTGATVAICPAVGADVERVAAIGAVRDLWRAAGAGKLLDVDPAEHDRAVTFASHLPYLAAAMVVDSLSRNSDLAPLARELAAGGFRDTTRLAGDGTVGGAAALNRHVPEAARELAEHLRALADQLTKSPQEALDRLGRLAEARRRMTLPPITPPR